MKSKDNYHVLFIIQDGSFTYDNRVRREAATLQSAGYEVSVICPRWEGDPRHKVDADAHVYYYRVIQFEGGMAGYLIEYLLSLVSILALTTWVRFRHGFDALHVCNPPDFLIPALVPFKLLGAKIVFDQHDLAPEVYASKFGVSTGLPYKMLLLLEKLSCRWADRVIATNQWHRAVQIERTGISAEKTEIVRNGPLLDKFAGAAPNPTLKRGFKYLILYLGNMNDHDGVDYLLRSIHYIHHELGYKDLGGVCIGSGPAFDALLRLRETLDLVDVVDFTGRLPLDKVIEYMLTADIGACPDPKTPLSDVSTMNKTMDYMGAGKPIVAFDLKETRCTAREAGLYAAPNDIEDYAQKIVQLIDSEDLRYEMGGKGQQYVQEELAWEHNAPRLVAVYGALFS